MKKILFITNGHGEDVVASLIIRQLKRKAGKIDILPVVGKGDHFRGMKVTLIGPKKILPSGGFGMRNFSFLIRDIFSGLLGKIVAQMRALRRMKGTYDLVVAIGDIVPIVYAMISGSRFVFVGVNKSGYYRKLAFNYTGLEKWLLKNYCDLTFTRDKKTYDDLKLLGINARYVGNPMMDAVKNIRITSKKTIGFLPGTREDAYKNIEDFYKIAWQIKKLDRTIRFIMSFPKTLDKSRLARIKNRHADIELSDDFNKVLSSSRIIIGLSGTGNEQAAGVGLPVIAFPGRGAQFNMKFAVGQKELLGDALLLMPRDSNRIAHEAIALMYNKKRRIEMGNLGKIRMGKAGASKVIAQIISNRLALN